jgi:murein DD-endopeptidase MepM/ murein hydrolase activator NlpD
MGELSNGRRGVAAAASISILAVVLAACGGAPTQPAPVFLRGATMPGTMGPASMAPAAPPPWRDNRVVMVEHGQTLSDIAHAYHVPERVIIAANQLQPPYQLRSGARLVIPDRGPAPPAMAQAAPPPAHPPLPAQPMTAAAAALAAPTGVAPPAAGAPAPATLTPPRPATSVPQPTAAAVPPPAAQPPSAARAQPEIVPLDTPPKPVASAAPQTAPPPTTGSAVPPVMPARNPAAALPLPGEAPATPVVAAENPANPASGRFPWPVSGRVLASYGSGSGDGTRNEGINIAAPRGTSVRVIDSGTVAYAGNELKGYGNLVLIKHANGWISAYAHLDDVLVKQGDTVSVGQVIAKVGSTGGVSEPQLHFELRRGKKPVDPREFLAPAPSAAVPGGKAG